MKDKIAICISGQTRQINKLGILEQLEEVLELFDEFDYDLYGHTWHDHDDPKKEFLDKFTEYQTEDQEVIWKDIVNLMYSEEKEEPKYQQFFQIDDQWRNKEEFMDMLHGKSDQNYLEFCKERIKGTLKTNSCVCKEKSNTENFPSWSPIFLYFLFQIRHTL